MSPRLLTKIALLSTLTGAALAQNSDFAFLVGGFTTDADVAVGSGVRVTSSLGVHAQLNYGYQVRGSRVGDLYVELPLVWGAHRTVAVSRAVAVSANTGLFFTPGLRFKVALNSRLAFYAALGGGIAAFEGREVRVSAADVSIAQGWRTHPALGFGGGLDGRLTRLLSLRVEARDFVARTGLGGSEGRHHTIIMGGVGFHF